MWEPHLTREQKQAIDNLRYEYGKEAVILAELRQPDEWPHGMAIIKWRPDQMPTPEEKVIYIDPSGTQVNWKAVEYEGGET